MLSTTKPKITIINILQEPQDSPNFEGPPPPSPHVWCLPTFHLHAYSASVIDLLSFQATCRYNGTHFTIIKLKYTSMRENMTQKHEI